MLRIGFDAKRAFCNKSGLGNYSRDVIRGLKRLFPENNYMLFTPQGKTSLLEPNFTQQTVSPGGFYAAFKPLWRSFGVMGAIKKADLNIYHGLSNELPLNIGKASCRKVVTIHDVIFLKHPTYYKAFDRFIYRQKTSHACSKSDLIIATSQCTKDDLLVYYPTLNPNTIQVAYQGCHIAFSQRHDAGILAKVRQKYGLPNSYILCVGSIEARKNFLSVLKALHTYKIDMPLVLAGRPTGYLKEIQAYAVKHRLEKKLWILHNVSNADMPMLFQMACMFVFPSHYEGFGIPVLEAFSSGTPVITSNYGSLAEIAADAALLVNPNDVEDIGNAITHVAGDSATAKLLIEKGYKRALDFSQERVINNMMTLYLSIL